MYFPVFYFIKELYGLGGGGGRALELLEMSVMNLHRLQICQTNIDADG